MITTTDRPARLSDAQREDLYASAVRPRVVLPPPAPSRLRAILLCLFILAALAVAVLALSDGAMGRWGQHRRDGRRHPRSLVAVRAQRGGGPDA